MLQKILCIHCATAVANLRAVSAHTPKLNFTTPKSFEFPMYSVLILFGSDADDRYAIQYCAYIQIIITFGNTILIRKHNMFEYFLLDLDVTHCNNTMLAHIVSEKNYYDNNNEHFFHISYRV